MPSSQRGRNAHVFSLCFSTPPTGATIPGTCKQFFWKNHFIIDGDGSFQPFPIPKDLENHHPIQNQPFHPDDHQVPGGCQMFNVSSLFSREIDFAMLA